MPCSCIGIPAEVTQDVHTQILTGASKYMKKYQCQKMFMSYTGNGFPKWQKNICEKEGGLMNHETAFSQHSSCLNPTVLEKETEIHPLKYSQVLFPSFVLAVQLAVVPLP